MSFPWNHECKPEVLFTGIDCTEEEQVVRELGGAVATTASDCTHLVTDKFRRTVKSLYCISKGTPIIDVSWIKKCHESKAFIGAESALEPCSQNNFPDSEYR
ncbi:hypothetical protein V5799_034045 [Amblyomma americanum]|uniref:PAX-interacting protein 1 n=1 Tax=Amblyomma americanum TaxID=6943 RepID=A0AAQ4DLK9_AMBAM